MKKIVAILMLLAPISTQGIYAQDVTVSSSSISYVTDLDLALSLSKETKQNVVLIFSASWCVHCNNLKNDLNNIDGFDNKIICILDSDKEKKLSRQFKVKSLPTSILLNSNGQEVSRLSGYNKTSYQKWLNK